MNCQVMGFDCPPADFCSRCNGTGNECGLPEKELCANCDHCFDEVLGWSTGIEPNSQSREAARVFCNVGWSGEPVTHEPNGEGK